MNPPHKYTLLAIFITLLLSSCDMLKSKDDFLTQEKWILWTSSTDSVKANNRSETLWHKSINEDLVLKFSPDSTVLITENKGVISETARWCWKIDVGEDGLRFNDTERIYIKSGKFAGVYIVFRLNGEDLGFYRYNSDSTFCQNWSFKHPDGEWYDSGVDFLNGVRDSAETDSGK